MHKRQMRQTGKPERETGSRFSAVSDQVDGSVAKSLIGHFALQ
jgi:hypothetical protein